MGGRSGTGVGGCGTGGRRRLQVRLRCSAVSHSTPLHHSHMPPHPHSTCHGCHPPPPPTHTRDGHGGGVGSQPPFPHGPSTHPTTPPCTHSPPHATHTHCMCMFTLPHTCTLIKVKNELDQVRRSFVFLVLFRKFICTTQFGKNLMCSKGQSLLGSNIMCSKMESKFVGFEPTRNGKASPLFEGKNTFF